MADEKDSNFGSESRIRTGRPGHDWEALYAEWRGSGLTKGDFLRNRGFKYDGGTVAVNTRDWLARLRDEMLRTTAQYTGSVGTRPVVGGSDGALTHTRAPVGGDGSVGGSDEWEAIARLRRAQAIEDWGAADRLRQRILEALADQTESDATDRKQLNPAQLKQLAEGLGQVQRIQRLALGLSTENVGVNAPAPHADQESGPTDESQKTRQTFVVEVSRDGRFVRPRPRMIG